jgi:hypothetical protein
VANFRFLDSCLRNILYIESICTPDEIAVLDAALANIAANPQLPGRIPSRMPADPNIPAYLYNEPPFWIHFHETDDGTIEFINVWLRF